ncbi:MAG: hypothetical protein EPN36_15525 [Rhodanobacteraceae bacterium]|nr:MAG: hypothetical protein EPN36_15525 [Rhodanobacteraceae bacterium]
MLCIGEEQSWIGTRDGNGETIAEAFRFELGDRSLVRNAFAGHFPNALQLERAIATVEDEVMRFSIQPGATIALCDRVLLDAIRAWLGWPLQKVLLRTEDVEAAFSRIVRGVQGHPSDRPDSGHAAEFAAYITILREMVHHWALGVIALDGTDPVS